MLVSWKSEELVWLRVFFPKLAWVGLSPLREESGLIHSRDKWQKQQDQWYAMPCTVLLLDLTGSWL